MNPEWTGEAIAAMIIVPVTIIVLAVGGWLLFRKSKEIDDEFDFWGTRILSVILLAWVPLTMVIFWWSMYPWKTEYHQWQPKSGVVSKVDQRLLNATGKFVVSFQGSDQQYGVIDTRAAGIEIGDKLTITCVKRWQWSGTHGYDCNFVSLESAK